MKSIYDIRRDNLNEIIRQNFDNTQLRFAERIKKSQNLVNRWCKGTKNIGGNAAREIEAFARKERFWLDIDHMSDAPAQLGLLNQDEWSVEKQASFTLGLWMGSHPTLNSEKKVSDAAGIGQATVNRILNCDGSTSIGVLHAIARAFGREAYELIMPSDARGMIEYDHQAFEKLPQEEKNKITAFIGFIFSQNRES
ncbi:MAG: helix-turn-helix transcriptional regulator [Klebsiella sp.]|uniref:helix-turn-helix transcriptional regulator n=1 Tax=Klebsiella sp. TaxID=576 RepID=UPI0029145BBD|nr:helix-turn-helix transcriptional regulator [Klebsiella sp.]MDU3360815.1 helix-turn-helix transcriptional regulator [Klebsiella sp.]